MNCEHTVIFGAGEGLSASLARRFSDGKGNVILVARNPIKLEALCSEIGAQSYQCDVTDPQAVKQLFNEWDQKGTVLKTVIYNVGAYTRGPIDQVDVMQTKDVLLTNAYGAMVVAQETSKRMINNGTGVMLFTGASAGVKGYAQSAPFAMGKFALRGLCQSLARELAPKGIHIAHVIIDGLIFSESRGNPYNNPSTTLSPDDIADTYFHIAKQDKSCWTYELELRPFCESF